MLDMCRSALKFLRCFCRVVVKLGPQQEMGIMLPKSTQGWRLCVAGHDFAVWEKGLVELPSGTPGNESAGDKTVDSDRKY